MVGLFILENINHTLCKVFIIFNYTEMRYLLYIILFFSIYDCFGQDTIKNSNSLIFIDSLKKNDILKIKCYASNCFHHENYTIQVWKKDNFYFAKLFSKSSSKGSKEVFVKKSANLNSKQIDSIRKFEYYLTIYPTEDTDGQTYYYYTLLLGKRKKEIFDGIQSDPWMRIEGLVKLLFPERKKK
jgi:hypothetical protein